ncbi:MAG: response regulator transcription factor [Acidimicrobiia bacterium]
MKVLLVEDDHAIATSLQHTLRHEGFDVRRVDTAAAALEAEPVDVVLLDVTLPDLSGFEVCRRLRAREPGGAPEMGIVMLTARGEEVDRVLGLELGADDYVVKPFSVRELVARVRAVGRRVGLSRGVSAEEPPSQALGPLTIDRNSRRVHLDGEELDLTAKEFDLLAYLAEVPGKVHTRQHLLTELWDPHWYGPTKTVDVHVASIRRKLGDAAWIEAVRGVGFRFEVPGGAEGTGPADDGPVTTAVPHAGDEGGDGRA